MSQYLRCIVLIVTFMLTLCSHAGNYGSGTDAAKRMINNASKVDPSLVNGFLHQDGMAEKSTVTQNGSDTGKTKGSIVERFGLNNQYEAATGIRTESDVDVSHLKCLHGDCADESYDKSPDFGKNAAKLTGLLEAGSSYNEFEKQARVGCRSSRHNQCVMQKITQILQGNHYRCHEAGFGYNNCCQQKGWGQNLGLAGCNSEEKQLGELRNKKWCVYAGNFCAKKVSGRCIEHKQSWCCYDSLLARVIEQQGHVQLNWSYGDPKMPSCHGFSVEQFQQLDLNSMNFSEVENEMKAKVNTISQSQLKSVVQSQTKQYETSQ